LDAFARYLNANADELQSDKVTPFTSVLAGAQQPQAAALQQPTVAPGVAAPREASFPSTEVIYFDLTHPLFFQEIAKPSSSPSGKVVDQQDASWVPPHCRFPSLTLPLLIPQ